MRCRSLVLFLAALVLEAWLTGSPAVAQCRGGGSGQGTAGAAGVGVVGSSGAGLLTGQGSLAYDMLAAQVAMQQMAQRQMLVAMQQQQVKQEKLAARRYRAEQTRSAVAESRARSRAALAAKSGGETWFAARPTATQPSLVALQEIRR